MAIAAAAASGAIHGVANVDAVPEWLGIVGAEGGICLRSSHILCSSLRSGSPAFRAHPCALILAIRSAAGSRSNPPFGSLK
jgi:hypothetical protein